MSNPLSKQDYRDLFETALTRLAEVHDEGRATNPGVLRAKARQAYLDLRALEDDLYRQRAIEAQQEEPSL